MCLTFPWWKKGSEMWTWIIWNLLDHSCDCSVISNWGFSKSSQNWLSKRLLIVSFEGVRENMIGHEKLEKKIMKKNWKKTIKIYYDKKVIKLIGLWILSKKRVIICKLRNSVVGEHVAILVEFLMLSCNAVIELLPLRNFRVENCGI